MDLKKMVVVVVKVAVMLFLLGFTAKADARFDPISLLSEEMLDGELRSTVACCDVSICTKSLPPQCRCEDVKETCHATCKNCKCTRSNPPQCRCTDITLFSYGRCTCPDSDAKAH